MSIITSHWQYLQSQSNEAVYVNYKNNLNH